MKTVYGAAVYCEVRKGSEYKKKKKMTGVSDPSLAFVIGCDFSGVFSLGVKRFAENKVTVDRLKTTNKKSYGRYAKICTKMITEKE